MQHRSHYVLNSTGQAKKQWHYGGTSLVRFRSGATPRISSRQAYTCHYSYYYSWLKQKENVEANCRLSAQNYLLLTNKRLLVFYEQKRRNISLKQINSIELHFKRLMLPLLLGGIVAPLSAAGLFNGSLGPLMGISLIISGILLCYYGWMGTWQLRLGLNGNYFLHYFTDEQSPRLRLFIETLNQKLKND
jgi:hypothetical protein